MKWKTHIAGAIVLTSLIIFTRKIDIKDAMPLLLGSAIGGLIPDIDMPKSLIGQMFLPISKYLNSKVGHRTLFHSLFFVVITSLIIHPFNELLSIGMAIGIMSHIVLDIFSPGTYGVRLFYPLKKKIMVFDPIAYHENHTYKWYGSSRK